MAGLGCEVGEKARCKCAPAYMHMYEEMKAIRKSDII